MLHLAICYRFNLDYFRLHTYGQKQKLSSLIKGGRQSFAMIY